MKDQKRWVYVVSFISGLPGPGRFRHFVRGEEATIDGFSSTGRFLAFIADEKLIAEMKKQIPSDYPFLTPHDKPLKIVEVYFKYCYETQTGMRFQSAREVPLLEDDWDFTYFVDYVPSRDLRSFLPHDIFISELPNLRMYLVEAKQDLSSVFHSGGFIFTELERRETAKGA